MSERMLIKELADYVHSESANNMAKINDIKDKEDFESRVAMIEYDGGLTAYKKIMQKILELIKPQV